MRVDKGSVSFRFAQRENAALLVQLYNDSFRADYLLYGQCPGYGKTVQQMEESIEHYPKKSFSTKGIQWVFFLPGRLGVTWCIWGAFA